MSTNNGVLIVFKGVGENAPREFYEAWSDLQDAVSVDSQSLDDIIAKALKLAETLDEDRIDFIWGVKEATEIPMTTEN